MTNIQEERIDKKERMTNLQEERIYKKRTNDDYKQVDKEKE